MTTAYYLATDGLLYQDPVLRGPGYFVVFDGADEPEIVVEAGALTPAEGRLRAQAALEQMGLDAHLVGNPRRVVRAFDHDGTDRRACYCLWLNVSGPVPRSAMAADAAGVAQPAGDADVFAFGRAWG